LLLGILLFNWAGFRLLSAYLETKAGRQLQSQLDKNEYDESSLISIKVPATHLSSYTLYGQSSRVDGELEYNGIRYRYVKWRIFNDSLELFCIPDNQATQILNARDDFFKLVNDLKHNGENKKDDNHAGFSKIFSPCYYTLGSPFDINFPAFALMVHDYCYTDHVADVYLSITEQPPDGPLLLSS
jgi:hypothetical protein